MTCRKPRRPPCRHPHSVHTFAPNAALESVPRLFARHCAAPGCGAVLSMGEAPEPDIDVYAARIAAALACNESNLMMTHAERAGYFDDESSSFVDTWGWQAGWLAHAIEVHDELLAGADDPVSAWDNWSKDNMITIEEFNAHRAGADPVHVAAAEMFGAEAYDPDAWIRAATALLSPHLDKIQSADVASFDAAVASYDAVIYEADRAAEPDHRDDTDDEIEDSAEAAVVGLIARATGDHL